MKNLPVEFEKRMKALLGAGFDDYVKSLENPPVKAFRVNSSKIAVEDFEKINPFGDEKIPYVEGGYYLNYEKVGNHPFHHAGLIYVQEPAAMAPAECVDIEPDSKVLDMCAAPGGKSTQLKNKLNQDGLLVSNEIIPSRCKILTGNIERLGFKNCVTTCMDTSRLAALFPDTFDIIMVDAPCSGEGMFRKEPVAVDEWSEENVQKCAERQTEVLENAVRCLASGGTIIYATCTFSLEENEMMVDAFLKAHPDFEIIPVKPEVQAASSGGIKFDGCECQNIHFARRFYPHTSRGEGQFMAVLKHKGEKMFSRGKRQKQQAKIDKILTDFLDDTLENYNKNDITIYGDTPVFYNGDIEIKKGNAFMCGVTIGEIKKNYLLPHHQLFMAYGKDFKRKIDLAVDSDDIQKYLHGEEIKTDCKNGWAAVTVCGVPIGGAKVSNGTAKNHYPKGLRILK
ncbi:MAG: RNA methyltransferase [Clostridia bacterium]|nr:RNA methyltransferase [Clostridia bacterium]